MRTLLPFGEILCSGRGAFYLTQPESLELRLRAIQPSLIVNAAAHPAVDKAAEDRSAAYVVDAGSVKVLADYAQSEGALLVHYLADDVLDGTKAGRYLETDVLRPLAVYGQTKLAGEEAILAAGCEASISRTSWACPFQGQNFVKTILRLALERESLDAVAALRGAPTSGELIADVTALAVAAWEEAYIAWQPTANPSGRSLPVFQSRLQRQRAGRSTLQPS